MTEATVAVSSPKNAPDDWPYPFWVAHRGAGKLAPENTLAAFRLGASHGYRMFECDAKLSRDGVLFLLHDATLERTTSGRGVAGERPWAELTALDAGLWHSRAYAGEPLPTLQAIASYCQHNGLALNIEIKPTPGTDTATGAAVARFAAEAWASQTVKPLLSSFEVPALEAAQAAGGEAAALPRGLLCKTLFDGWLTTAKRLECAAVIARHDALDASAISQAQASGLKVGTYTVNDEAEAERLKAAGIDFIITDRVDLFSPAND